LHIIETRLVFDPFGDFETEGYFRRFGEKQNLDTVKGAEPA